MARQRFMPEQIIGQLREVEVAVARGTTISEACPGMSISEQPLYRCRRDYDGMKVDQACRPSGGERSALQEAFQHQYGPEGIAVVTFPRIVLATQLGERAGIEMAS
jgi:putative transposase